MDAMMNRFKNLNWTGKEVSFRWIISYLVVMLIPVLICSIAFAQSQRFLRRQITDVNSLLLKQTASQLENAVADIQRISSDIELNANISDYIYHAGDEAQQQMMLRQVRKELADYINTTENQLFLFLYRADTDTFLTSQGLYSSKVFYENYLDTSVPYNVWRTKFCEGYDGSFFADKFAFDELHCVEALGYSRGVPAMSLTNSKMFLGMMYNMTDYYDVIKETAFLEKGAMAVFDANAEEMFANGLERFRDISMEETEVRALTTSGTLTRRSHGHRVIVTYDVSEKTGWRYVYLIPQKFFLEKMNNIFYLIVFSMVLIFCIGGVVVYFMVKKNYAPLRQVLSLLEIEGKGGQNEFEVIQEWITKTIEEKHVITTTLDKQNLIVQKNYITKLLLGKANYKVDIAEMLANLKIPFAPQDSYAVIMLNVESYDEFFDGEKEFSDYERNELLDFMFENVFSELIQQENYVGVVLPYIGNIFCIVGGETVELSRLEAVVRHGQQFFDDNFRIVFSGIISDVNAGYRGIYEGYRQVIEAGESRFLLQNQALILYRDLVQSKQSVDTEFWTMGLNAPLFEMLIEKGDKRGATDYLNTEIARKENMRQTSTAAFRFYVYEITELLLNTGNAVCGKEAVKEMQEELLSALESNLRWVEYRELFERVIGRMCDLVDGTKQVSDVVQRIVSYVDKNYAEDSLNISTMAEALGLSDRYISAVFKKEKNMGLLDYIGMVRIEKAKMLLTETYMNIEDIYQKIGFTNKITFIRIFKKHEGITPTQYRKSSMAAKGGITGKN